jgi:hypothetical protein
LGIGFVFEAVNTHSQVQGRKIETKLDCRRAERRREGVNAFRRRNGEIRLGFIALIGFIDFTDQNYSDTSTAKSKCVVQNLLHLPFSPGRIILLLLHHMGRPALTTVFQDKIARKI